jgi:glycerophosphoryl diester phosphodiesterase
MNDTDTPLGHAYCMEALNRIETTPLLFAHRGGKADAPENTIEAFKKAVLNGSNGLESDAQITKCGHVVLHHNRHFGRFFNRKTISRSELASLPSTIPSLQSFYSKIDGDYDFSIDIKDEKAVKKVLEVSKEFSFPLKKLWLCHPSVEKISLWRDLDSTVRLVNSTTLEHVKEGPERRIATLSEVGADAFNMHFSEWNEALVSLCHRFQIRSFAWDAQEERQINWLLSIGIDGIFSDHVERMTSVWEKYKE